MNADVPEQLITPLVSLGHISMLAPDQFASPMKSVVANFIVKDLLMNDRVRFSFFFLLSPYSFLCFWEAELFCFALYLQNSSKRDVL